AVAGALAGAVSMAAGEYLATKSQDENLEAELALERTHILHFKDQELEQLRGFFTDMGVGEVDLDGVIAGFENNDEAILNAMAALEFGVVESERRSPYLAMAASGLLFLVGSLPSVVPFVLIDSIGTALIWATGLSLAGLFLVGVVKARVAKSHWLRSGFENMAIAGVGGVIAWAIGNAVGATLA
ncbi:MAG: VIT1/CCC1 transporter family protein, partial [Actinobacteria bacterium]|nr:VIT1/CCC1 transporter family protein [Actinomycetota bacterium]